MDFSLTEEQKLLKATVREFAKKELEPHASQIDAEATYPIENFRRMAQLGLTGLPFPRECGGADGGILSFIIVVEELSRVCASSGTIYLVTCGLAGHPLCRFGNETQLKRFAAPLGRGDKIACFALTEPSAGSDVASLETTVTKKTGGYTLNGTKVFITNGAEADLAVVFGTLDKSLRHKGILALVVEKNT